MHKFVLASRNKKKILELETLFAELSSVDIKLMSLDDIGYTGDIEEDGETFEQNAAIKSGVPASLGYIGISDDSGLAVDALGGAPGVYSARYSGEGATDEKNNQKLLSELEGYEDKTAHYVCAVCVAIPDALGIEVPEGLYDVELSEYASKKCGTAVKTVVVRGECDGVIINEPHGDGGFGYDPYFYFEQFGKTFAQVTAEEKHSVSHRGKAMRELIKILKTIFSEEN